MMLVFQIAFVKTTLPLNALDLETPPGSRLFLYSGLQWTIQLSFISHSNNFNLSRLDNDRHALTFTLMMFTTFLLVDCD
jgi:hypothetical protein